MRLKLTRIELSSFLAVSYFIGLICILYTGRSGVIVGLGIIPNRLMVLRKTRPYLFPEVLQRLCS